MRGESYKKERREYEWCQRFWLTYRGSYTYSARRLGKYLGDVDLLVAAVVYYKKWRYLKLWACFIPEGLIFLASGSALFNDDDFARNVGNLCMFNMTKYCGLYIVAVLFYRYHHHHNHHCFCWYLQQSCYFINWDSAMTDLCSGFRAFFLSTFFILLLS